MAVLLGLPMVTTGQAAYNHPELNWHTIEGTHFIVHYHDGTEWTANEALTVAEDIYPAITGLYHYEPEEKTQLIIRDTDDYANGGAYYFDNKIEIWAMPLDYSLRGSHYWLRDVLTHEFTHIITLRAARKFGGNVPAGYFQILQFEPERRDDVLYGYPNGIMSYPLPGVVVPMWWAEGVAQFQSNEKRYDWWDSIRDMIVRDRLAHNQFPTFTEINSFGKEGVGNEAVYNQGFNLVHFLADNWGEEILNRITDRLRSPTTFNFYQAVSAETGLSKHQFHTIWRDSLEQAYGKILADSTVTPLHFIQKQGATNSQPRWAAGDSILGFIGNAGQSYMSLTSLYLKHGDAKPEELTPGAEGFDWSPDGKRVVISHKNFYDGGLVAPPAMRVSTLPGSPIQHDPENLKHQQNCERCQFALTGSRFNDLFIRSIHPDSVEKQITFGERAKNPAWAPTGDKIVYVTLHDGTNNLKLVYPQYPDSTEILTHFSPGTQVFSPRWVDSTHIVFDYVTDYNRDIGIIDILAKKSGEGSEQSIKPKSLLENRWDERDPYPVNDSILVYSHDKTGVFNIYQRNLKTGAEVALSHVVGGAFQPELIKDDLVYSLYDSLGFNIAQLGQDEFFNDSLPEFFSRHLPRRDWSSHTTSLASEPYATRYGPMFILPRLQIDIDQSKHKTIVKPGFFFFSNEILDNYLLMGGADVGLNKDLDLFLLAEYRGFLPTLSLEVYHMARNTNEKLIYDPYPPTNSEIKFRLTQATMKASVKIPDYHHLDIDITSGIYNTYIGDHVITPFAGGSIAVEGFDYDYFKGIDWGLHYQLAGLAVRQERSINPSGSQLDVSFRDNYHNFMSNFGYREDTGTWGEIYSLFHYQRLDIKHFYGKRLSENSKAVVSLNTEMTVIPHNGLDDFFYDFAGGLPGLRGYPFYGLSGTRKAVMTGTLRFPVLRNLYKPIAQYALQDVYLGIVGQIGSAWIGNSDASFSSVSDFNHSVWNDLDNSKWLKDVGLELRLAGFSFYGYPTAIEFAGYYGFDPLSITTTETTYQYGQDVRYYWRVLFGFE